mgnify:CR=1 FL=1
MHTLPPDLRAFGWNETKGGKQIEVRTKRCGVIDVAISEAVNVALSAFINVPAQTIDTVVSGPYRKLLSTNKAKPKHHDSTQFGTDDNLNAGNHIGVVNLERSFMHAKNAMIGLTNVVDNTVLRFVNYLQKGVEDEGDRWEPGKLRGVDGSTGSVACVVKHAAYGVLDFLQMLQVKSHQKKDIKTIPGLKIR